MIDCMSSVLEIENALRQLPPQERWEVARWLLKDLEAATASPAGGKPDNHGGHLLTLPDYSARRRRIFGNKVLPNVVLTSRANEPW